MDLDIKEETETDLIFHEAGLLFYENKAKFSMKDFVDIKNENNDEAEILEEREVTVASNITFKSYDMNSSARTNEAEYGLVKEEIKIEEEDIDAASEDGELVYANGGIHSINTDQNSKESCKSTSRLVNHLEKKHSNEAEMELGLEGCGQHFFESEGTSTERETFKINESLNVPETLKSYLSGHSSVIFDKLKYFNCDECGYFCSRKSDLSRHISSIHKKLKPFKCTECDFYCSHKSNLSQHISRIHKKLKPFMCNECDYSSSHKGCLNMHISAVHKKLKPFKCDECGYSCSRKHDLSKHISAVHKRQKPFRCDECDYCCSKKGHLFSHISAVHQKLKPFMCEECHYSCYRKSDLSTHISAVHKKQKPFKCDECDYSCSKKHCLLSHISAVHQKLI